VPAQFVLKKGTTGKFRFNLVATNGQVIATSEAYETRAKALAGIESVRKNAPNAAVNDQTAPAAAKAPAKAAAKAPAKAAKGAAAAPPTTGVCGRGGTAMGANKSPAKAAAMPSPTPADAKGTTAAAKKPAARKPAKKAGV
jgi:uncharacterized protein YegP (UPF0339 family)